MLGGGALPVAATGAGRAAAAAALRAARGEGSGLDGVAVTVGEEVGGALADGADAVSDGLGFGVYETAKT